MPKTILFDLDGTLFPVDTDHFAGRYLKALATYTAHLVPPQQMIEQVLASTAVMIRNRDRALTNETVFFQDFFPKIGRLPDELVPVLDRFYREVFPGLDQHFGGLPGPARQVVQAALDAGYEVALATNPLFPRLATEARMRWIGVHDLPWLLVTTYEDSASCKPHPDYFREVLTRIGRRPEECIMVGNDVQEDGVAAQLGIDVFYVTDFLIDREGKELPADRSDTLAGLLTRLQTGSFV